MASRYGGWKVEFIGCHIESEKEYGFRYVLWHSKGAIEVIKLHLKFPGIAV
jgi:hypothetical protein